MKKTILTISAILLFNAQGSILKAQRIVNIKSEYICEVPSNISADERKKQALAEAQIKALAEEFGTFIAQTNTSAVSTVNEQSDVRFHSYRTSDVRGEWISDIEKPHYKFYYDEQERHMLRVTVHFRAREIEQSKIDCAIVLLRNNLRFRQGADYRFVHGDRVSMAFRSPVNGYLSVYLDDGQGNIFCMLPYPKQDGYAFSVNKNREYHLFDWDAASPEERDFVEQYTMQAPNGEEHNRIFVLFSPRRFAKASDRPDADNKVPPQLNEKDFHEWLGRCRKADKEMQTFEFPITILSTES